MNNTIISGGITSTVAQVVTWPLEYLKTIKQLPKYRKTTFVNLVRSEINAYGIRTLYTGLSAQILAVFPRGGLRFYTYEKLKEKWSVNGELSNVNRFSAGFLSGIAESFIIQTPAEAVKIESINKRKDTYDIFRNKLKDGNIFSFWKGSLPTVIKQGTSQAITFVVYENTKPILDRYKVSQSALLAGLLGGTTVVLANTPIDVVKTYKQSDRKKSSLLDIFKEIYNKKGVKGFYSGCSLRLLRVVPLHGLTFFVYDYCK